MAKVLIYCDCGKQIWQDATDLRKVCTIATAEEAAQCSDCVMEQVLADLKEEGT